MKNFKKLFLSLGAVLLFTVLFSVSHKAHAADRFTESYWKNGPYTLQDDEHIIVGNGGNTFTFSNPNGSTFVKGTYHDPGYPLTSPGICPGTNSIVLSNPSDISKQSFTGKINVNYNVTTTDSAGHQQASCQNYSGTVTISNPKAGGTCNYVACSKADITNLADAAFKFIDPGSISVTFKGKVINFSDGDTSDSNHTYQAPAGTFCSGGGRDHFGAITVTDADFTKVDKSHTTVPGSLDADWYSAANGSCNDFGTDSNNNTSAVKINAAALIIAAGQSCSPPNATQGAFTCSCVSSQGCVWAATTTSGTIAPDNSCEANYTGAAHVFNWAFCSMLEAADQAFKYIYDQLDAQLTICTGTTSSTTGADEHCNNLLTPEVEKSWAIFRDIASALLVIIMLVMIFSQAISFGPFDAYTLRKLLPRLVAAVILIQISWVMLKFFVDLTNDIGNSVQSLLLVPFGGAGSLDLDNAIGAVGKLAPGAVIGATTVFTGAAIAFSGVTIFGWLLLGVSAVVSVLVGWLLLVLRQMLIIMAIILAPIALIAFVLPGTQRYWKLWYDNFTKLLLMFPLIMAMIAAGKIFAHIGGQSNNALFGLIFVLVGFLAPLWFLPKAFRWGGQMFSAASNGVMNGTKQFRNYPGKYALGNAKENRQFNAAERATRIGRDPAAASRWDRMLAGGYNFAKNPGSRNRQYARTVAEGQKAAREAVSEELTTAGYENWTHNQKLNALESWLRGEKDDDSGISAEGNDELRLFAFKTLADLGDQDRIRKARKDGKLKGSIWLKGRAENIGQLNSQASDMGIEYDLSAVSPDKMAGWKGHTWKEWIEQVQSGMVMDNSDNGGGLYDITEIKDDQGRTIGHDASRRDIQIQRAQAQAQRILDNTLIFDRLSAEQQEIVRGMASAGGTQVVASRMDAGVSIPTAEAFRDTSPVTAGTTGPTIGAAARQNVVAGLSAPSGRGGVNPVAIEWAPRIIEAARARVAGTPLTADQQADMDLYEQLYDRGTAPDATPEMESAIRNVEAGINATLAQREAETERTLTAAGDPAPTIASGVATERSRSDDVKRTLGI